MQTTTFTDNTCLEALIRNPNFGVTTLSAWLLNNGRDSDGLDLTYPDYPSNYKWVKNQKSGNRELGPVCGQLADLHMFIR